MYLHVISKPYITAVINFLSFFWNTFHFHNESMMQKCLLLKWLSIFSRVYEVNFVYFSTWKEKRKNCLLWSKDFQKFSRWNNPNYIFLGAHGFVLPGRGYGQCYQSWPRSVRHVQTGTILRWSSQRVYHWWEKISPRFAYDYQSI